MFMVIVSKQECQTISFNQLQLGAGSREVGGLVGGSTMISCCLLGVATQKGPAEGS